jgi:hypothetical protein
MNQPIHNPAHITIDKKPKTSPNPTTGVGLYALGEIPSGYDLFREVRGKGDDQLIANDASSITLQEGEHFYSAQSTLNPGNLL